MLKLGFVTAVSLLMSAQAQASSCGGNTIFKTTFHHSATVGNKTVAAVHVNTGINTDYYQWCGSGFCRYDSWQSVKFENLVREGDAFVLKSDLAGYAYMTSGPGQTIKDAVVQYWVDFTDGSSSVSQVYVIPVVSTFKVLDATNPSADVVGSIDAFFNQPITTTRAVIVTDNSCYPR